ncbi:MAG: acyltransferase [Ignavibacteriales bacterium]|nr:acyltransferase [Ignavibacteriales bacterium]
MKLKFLNWFIRLFHRYINIIRIQFYEYDIKKGLLSCGKNVSIKSFCVIEGKECVSVGDNVSIGSFIHIWGHGGVTIRNNVMIAAHTSITSLTHDYTVKEMIKTVVKKSVIIEDDVWIGSNVVICPGVRIGKGSVVGAGSVVTKNIDPYTINFGVPAKKIKDRIIPHMED